MIVFRLHCRLSSNTSQTTRTHAWPCFDGCCKSAAVAPLATGLRNERPWGTYVLSCIMQSDVNKTELWSEGEKERQTGTQREKLGETLWPYWWITNRSLASWEEHFVSLYLFVLKVQWNHFVKYTYQFVYPLQVYLLTTVYDWKASAAQSKSDSHYRAFICSDGNI